MRLAILPVLLSAMLTVGAAHAGKLTGVIGDTDLTLEARAIAPGASSRFAIPKGSGLLLIREVYPDAPKQPRYTYDARIGGRTVCRRDRQGTGFGPVSCFARVPAWASDSRGIVIVNRGSDPIHITSVDAVDEGRLESIGKADRFGLSGLVTPYEGEEKAREYLDYLAAHMPVKEGFYPAFTTEVAYAARTPEQVRDTLEMCLRWAGETGISFMPFLVSWWAATPLGVPDGLGGAFRDIRYQQVCWSPDDNTDEGPEFRALMGDRWDIRYGLSVPNQWSSVPWLTMNSSVLNDYRHKRMAEAVGILADAVKKTGVKVAGVTLENEPRYWDDACEAGNPKREWKTCWADFNPLTVADAAKDGIDLDPSDGLDHGERLWLHRNVSRYNQSDVDCARKALESAGLGDSIDVYTHSLQLVGFPGDEIGHAMSEWAYADGAFTGLEGMWMKLADLDRVREWGIWANINREEGDGRDILEHLWDLRVTYARGGQIYNSYNWHAIGMERYFNYVREFLDRLPEVSVTDADIRTEGPRTVSFRTQPDVQGANVVRAKVEVSEGIGSALCATVRDPDGALIGFARVEGPIDPGTREVEFAFAEPFELLAGQRGTLEVSPEEEPPSAVKIVNAQISFDLRRERTQCLYVMESSKLAQADRGL